MPGGKSLFVRGGHACFDVGFVGCVEGRRRVSDGKWHHIAFTGGSPQNIYVDGALDGDGCLERRGDVKGNVFKLGNTSSNFPSSNQFRGELDDVRVYGRALSAKEIKEHFRTKQPGSGRGLVAYWPFDGDTRDASGSLNHASPTRDGRYVAGKFGKAIELARGGHLTVRCGKGQSPDAALWAGLGAEFSDPVSTQEMRWERADGIWGADWKSVEYSEAARRYASSAQRPSAVAREIGELAAKAKTSAGLKGVRALYLKSKRYGQLLEKIAEFKLKELRQTISELYGGTASARKLTERLDAIEGKAARWPGALAPDGSPAVTAAGQGGPPGGAAFEDWKSAVAKLRSDVILMENPLVDFDKIVFVRRLTYSANHYYTEFINSRWTPGGNICVLDLKTGKVKELVTKLQGGVFGRFDLSWDAKKIVFAWKCAHQQGYRVYEMNVDGTGLRQLTFPEKNEQEIVRLYRARAHYHHGTDDMHPCYLADDDSCFISTRCQYGILCDAPDDFTTTVLYRMDRNGKNMQKLSNSSVSEASPAMLHDGRIMYTRWEYVDKGAVSVKCLWVMRPDGGASAEIYANDISLPPTFIYGRPIPGTANKYVALGTPHCPQNGIGTVIRLDMTRNIRTREPMTYMTPYVDIQSEGGFSFRKSGGGWRRDGGGRGPLFKDPYPLSEKLFLVAHKPEGSGWNDPKGYGLYLLDEKGNTYLIYKDPEISCWEPFPLRPRKRPPVLSTPRNPKMAAKNLATCIVTDVYHGLDVERGAVKHIRVLEQVPRPWATRRRWGGDGYDQQHATITKDTHLGLKVQHGVVPVEDDGSAHFVVPAMKNIFLQVLDENYMALQTERTYVNYMPGETRSCIGCHETQRGAGKAASSPVVKALMRAPSVPGAQLGEKTGGRPLYYPVDVQPVLDKHCVKCHSGKKPKGGLNLTGEMTALFSVSYESLIPERRRGRGRRRFELVGPTIGENHPKTGNVHYMPARSFGSHNSVLVAMHAKGKVKLRDRSKAELASKLAAKHKDVKLKPEELLKITNWVDTNSQFYGSYWGRKNLRYKGHPNFRPVTSYEAALSMTSPIPEDKR